ncbi:leucyl aminopeptidase, partial [Pseudoalteromonas issachenkonii]
QVKSKKVDPRRPLRKIVFNVQTRRELTIGESAIDHGLAIAAGSELCKDVANMPPNICDPVYLGEQAQELATDFD